MYNVQSGDRMEWLLNDLVELRRLDNAVDSTLFAECPWGNDYVKGFQLGHERKLNDPIDDVPDRKAVSVTVQPESGELGWMDL